MRLFTLLLCFIFLTTALSAQNIALIPQPVSLKTLKGSFRLTAQALSA